MTKRFNLKTFLLNYLVLVAIATLPVSLVQHWDPSASWLQTFGNCTADYLYATLMIVSCALLAALAAVPAIKTGRPSTQEAAEPGKSVKKPRNAKR